MRSEENYLELLKIDAGKKQAIAVVGGGGKTSLIFRLMEELVSGGKTVVVTTTTHMMWEKDRPLVNGADVAQVRENLEKYGYTMAARWQEGEPKVSGLSEEELETLKGICDVLLIEADGSSQHPLKVPEAWEPAIPRTADLVVSVVGLDCLGKPIHQTAHRVERTAQFLHKNMDAPVTAEDVIRIASSICGLFKDVEDRIYRVYLNKADVLPDEEPARMIVEGLAHAHMMAAYGSLQAGHSGGKRT